MREFLRVKASTDGLSQRARAARRHAPAPGAQRIPDGGAALGPSFDAIGIHAQVAPGTLQPKLTVSEPGDLDEQEADRVADGVMRMADAAAVPPVRRTEPAIQRACAACQEGDGEAQRVQRAPREGAAPAALDAGAGVGRILREAGEPLPGPARAFMEQRFAHDFSRVRVHAGPVASEAARALRARAFTVGQHVVFGPGELAPQTHAGRWLLAHELTHTLQQGGAASSASGPHAAPLRVQREAEGEQPTQGGQESSQRTQGTSQGDEATELAGLCIRTPFPPGQVRIHGTAAQLADYAVMPESGTTLTHPPASGAWYDSDGFWYRPSPCNRWFKVPSHCDVTVQAATGSFSYESCCNAAASLIKGSPRWSTDGHPTTNPFCATTPP